MKTESQNKKILNYLLKGETLTPLKALKMFDTWSLSSRISNINEAAGYKRVKAELITVRSGKRVARYSIPLLLCIFLMSCSSLHPTKQVTKEKGGARMKPSREQANFKY